MRDWMDRVKFLVSNAKVQVRVRNQRSEEQRRQLIEHHEARTR
jgi:hypothetical protein